MGGSIHVNEYGQGEDSVTKSLRLRIARRPLTILSAKLATAVHWLAVLAGLRLNWNMATHNNSDARSHPGKPAGGKEQTHEVRNVSGV